MDDLISRQAAIEAINQICPTDTEYNCTLLDKVDVKCVLTDLPSALKFCEYCNEDSDGYVTPIEKNNHAFVRFGMNGWELSMKASGWHGSAKIRYCPMCGRDLLVK